MTIKTERIEKETKGFSDVIDITNDIEEFIDRCKVANGIATVFIPGSTGAVTTVEYEPGLKKDIPEFVNKILPQDAYYHHNETWHDGNGFSHMRAALYGPSLTVPFENGRLALGTWQQIVLLDFDARPRKRRVIIQIIGE
ncbi:secondary thiamine-phosphate synthase enzyme YjbQ [candidate division WOR-3 bacterium]|nr:secondary thiamine-phosphate synthase enzyme YjbQ [candidate division WOR-3 bacterium]